MRRDFILDAAVEVIATRGVAGASVGLVCERARVSSRTFYECFAGLDECLIAVLDGALARAAPLVVRAFDRLTPTHPWQEGMRDALAAMLEFFDSEPALARVCLLELGTAAPVVREHRERILAAFAALVLERIEPEVSHPSPLAAEGTYAAVVGIVQARLTGAERAPLMALLGPLMGIVLAPFLDEAQVAQEVRRAEALAREIVAGDVTFLDTAAGAVGARERVLIPTALRNPRARRARECLIYLAEWGGREPGPSNREIAKGVGVRRDTQISTLLARLAGMGLVEKYSSGPGRANAWRLTELGERVAQALKRGL